MANHANLGKSIEVEDIEEMRREQGIEDVQLWQEIGGLHSGDFVRLTLVSSNKKSFETVLVRITSIRGHAYRGKLVDKPASSDLSPMKAGSPLVFTAANIHSVVKGQRV